MTEKENSILEKAEDAILRKFQETAEQGEPMTESQFTALMDGVRVLDRICRMKYQTSSQSDKSNGVSQSCSPN